MSAAPQTPLVTVVIPARNEGEAIQGALANVAAQTYPLDCVEVVVVDGDSQDQTAAFAQTGLDAAPFRRTAVVHNPTASTPSNLNAGLEWAAGEILVRVDSRSMIPPDYIETLVAVLADPAIAVAGGSQVAVPRSTSMKDRAIARALNNRVAMGGSSYRRDGAPSGPVDTVYLGVFRTRDLRAVGGWSEDFPTNQDFELNRRMSERGHVWFEAGLPVGYFGREHFRELWAQYHRFGRWKVRYWQRTQDKPQPRQTALVVAPLAAGLVMCALGLARPRTVLPIVTGVVPGLLTMDAMGGKREGGGVRTRLTAGYVNAIVGAGWWSGVARQLIESTTDESPNPLRTGLNDMEAVEQ